MQRIFLDYHSTTPVPDEVWDAMRRTDREAFANPSSSHGAGRSARRALEDAREQIAPWIGAFPDEVIFTSGATEANNLALFGLAGEKPMHLLASPIEHPCVIEPLAQLSSRGFDLEWLPVDADGRVTTNQVASLIRPATRLVSVMLVNHETGAIQPIEELRARCRGLRFHCDAAQAAGKMPLDFHTLGVDALTLSGHKFGAPKGIGALVLRRDLVLKPLFFGGHQQQGRRPGTEPVALAVGMAMALEMVMRKLNENREQMAQWRNRFLQRLQSEATPVVVNGPGEESLRVPHVLNVSFPGCRSDVLLMKLDLAGVACSTGSACSSGSLLPSPVLKAMGVSESVLRSAMRFSFGPGLEQEPLDEAANRIIRVVRQLRESDAESSP